MVRVWVARNPNHPAEAMDLLAVDPVERVRCSGWKTARRPGPKRSPSAETARNKLVLAADTSVLVVSQLVWANVLSPAVVDAVLLNPHANSDVMMDVLTLAKHYPDQVVLSADQRTRINSLSQQPGDPRGGK